MKILIVDDEPLARQRLTALTNQLGHQSLTAANGQQARALAEQADVALLDIEMPRENGLTLAGALACPVIFCTAHSHYALEAWEVGALHYLTKPVRVAQLKQALARVNHNNQLVRMHCGHAVWQVDWSQVVLARADSKHTVVETLLEERVINESLKELLHLPDQPWLQISRGILVNPSHVRLHASDHLLLNGRQQPFPISRRQRPIVKATLDALTD